MTRSLSAETQFERVIDIESNAAQGLNVATEDRALLRTQLERRCSLANGGCGCLRAAHGLRPVPAGASPKRKIPGVRGTESPDSFDNTLKKTENYVSVFSGELHSAALNCARIFF
jgi:hypothetical protein